jgi:hypothetical protein
MRILMVVAVLGAALPIFAQSNNAMFVELGGSAVALSVNYERRFRPVWFGRVGLSVVESTSSGGETDTSFIIPLTASWVNRPQANHHLELGGGVTFAGGDRHDLFGSDSEGTYSTLILTGIAGYRYQKPDGGFQFRAVLTPFAGGGDSIVWAGFSFGYAW